MSNEMPTLYRLMVLYMLSRVDFPLTNSQISEIVLEKGYTSYFNLQEAINGLSETGLISTEKQHSNSFYTLTPEGLDTIRDFEIRIPETIREELSKSLLEHQHHLKNENEIVADYYRDAPGRYIVNCSIRSRDEMLSGITLNLPDEESAALACDNWKKRYEEIYLFLAGKLLSK